MSPSTLRPRLRARVRGVVARLRGLLRAPLRRVRRERRARELAATHTPAELEAAIDRKLRTLESFAKTAAYKRAVQDAAAAPRYERRADELATELRAHVRAWAILRSAAVHRTRREGASSRDDRGPTANGAGRGHGDRRRSGE